MSGTFDYKKTPLAPLGIKVLAYEMPLHRASWASHGKEGWYVGPAREHYQCYRVLIKSTKSVRTPPKVKFFPARGGMSTNLSTDRIWEAATQLTHALQNPSPPVPFEHVGNKDMCALHKLASIFQKRATQKIPEPTHQQPVQRMVESTPRVVNIVRQRKHLTKQITEIIKT